MRGLIGVVRASRGLGEGNKDPEGGEFESRSSSLALDISSNSFLKEDRFVCFNVIMPFHTTLLSLFVTLFPVSLFNLIATDQKHCPVQRFRA